MIKNKYKHLCIFLLLIFFIITIFNNKKQSKNELACEFSKYKSFNSIFINDYFLKYQETNNYIYSLNQVNYPNFLTLDTSEQYLNINNLILVNPKFYLEKSYIPSNLKALNDIPHIKRENETMMLDDECLTFYKLMYNDAKAKNINLIIFSGYRSYQKQEIIYSSSSNKSYVAAPGHSEHQTGLAVDISTLDTGLTTNFENTSVFKYLKENAHRFGFILRYPKSKEAITGYNYEPWHFRYVGIKIASNIYHSNLTLEEYIYQYFEL